jgi:hypothetical protein
VFGGAERRNAATKGLPLDDFSVGPSSANPFARQVSTRASTGIKFSICTLVTDWREYSEMVDSFVAGGFYLSDCEYLFINNTEKNEFEAYGGYNAFLVEARGDYIVLCHQDIVLLDDDRRELENRLGELSSLDPDWALCGNCGGDSSRKLAIRISDPAGGENQRIGEFPMRVTALDENFIVVRRQANLALSRDLWGFHHYGTDICIVADILGWNAWVIDFHLRHKSAGNVDEGYVLLRRRLIQKYRNAFRPRWAVTSINSIFLSRYRTANMLAPIGLRVQRRAKRILLGGGP